MPLLLRLWAVTVIMLTFLAMGCASGIGINRHEYFESSAIVSLPAKIVVDDSTRSAESSLSFGKDAAIQAFLVSGVVGAAMTDSPIVTGVIRGRYQIGKLIEQVTASMIEANGLKDEIHFHLDSFHYVGDRGRLKIMMEFDTRLGSRNDITRSAYACDMEIKFSFLGFSPQMEKDMIREMVEYTLNHWGNKILPQLDFDKGNVEFPPATNGRFSGRGVDCVYDVFIRPKINQSIYDITSRTSHPRDARWSTSSFTVLSSSEE